MTRRITVGSIAVTSPSAFRVEGIALQQDQAFRKAGAELLTEFSHGSETDGGHTFTMKPEVQTTLHDDAVAQALETIERRINELGVTEPAIARQGSNRDQILVQLPGVTDVNRAKDIIQSTGFLELKIVERGPASMPDALLLNGRVPDGMEIVPAAHLSDDPTVAAYYLVRKAAAVTGRDVRNARPSLDENNQPAVSFTLSMQGGRAFGVVTSENIGHELAIVLDGRVQSTARIDSRITTDGRIYGRFTQEEAQDLALILRAGALPAPTTILEQRTVGPSLGADAIRSGVLASTAGLLLVVVFMLAYYKGSGVNAVSALVLNLVILLGLMAYLGAVMTLPGIAGFVLTMGIGVDSNVLIFERIKEELDAGRGIGRSIDAGFSRVFLTLLDTHVAALISAAFLFWFGTGAVRGFAVTLFVGLGSNLFTSTFVSKTLFELTLKRQASRRTISI